MKYANTAMTDIGERIITVLPLSAVPGFNPLAPPQPNTYCVPDDVQVGWIADGHGGFVSPDLDPLPIGATPFQFRKALNASGLRSAVEAYIAGADQDIKDGYEFATEFRSDDPMVLAAAAAVGKTPDEAYEFIAFAKTL